jgi:hypothetical protein
MIDFAEAMMRRHRWFAPKSQIFQKISGGENNRDKGNPTREIQLVGKPTRAKNEKIFKIL